MLKKLVFYTKIALTFAVIFLLAQTSTALAACECRQTRACTCLSCIASNNNTSTSCTCQTNSVVPELDTGETPYSPEINMGSADNFTDAGFTAAEYIDTSAEILMDSDQEQPSEMAIFGAIVLERNFSQEVKHLQIYLNAYIRRSNILNQEEYLDESGIFDADTEHALRKFQIEQNITEYGFAGEKTKARLFELMGDLIHE